MQILSYSIGVCHTFVYPRSMYSLLNICIYIHITCVCMDDTYTYMYTHTVPDIL